MTTLGKDKIESIAKAVATANLSSANVSTVTSAPAFDSEGHDALRITIILRQASTAAKLDGLTVINTLAQIRDSLQAAGEQRFPIVQFATKEELAESDDS